MLCPLQRTDRRHQRAPNQFLHCGCVDESARDGPRPLHLLGIDFARLHSFGSCLLCAQAGVPVLLGSS